ncbi:MAG: squalene--hopene cyclase [Rhodospirillales bacterium]
MLDDQGTLKHSLKSFEKAPLDLVIEEAVSALLDKQYEDGRWAYELEADATITAEYILLNHYLGEIDDEVEAKLAAYLRSIQGSHGGWPLYHDGDFDMSASVKAYYALKLTGEDIEAPHMKWARHAILSHGGAEKSNVFSRFTLALFGQVPWRAVPVIRVEAMLLPKWALFHINNVSYWSRTVMVPLFIISALKPRAKNPRGISIEELFVTPPKRVFNYLVNPSGNWLGTAMVALDGAARVLVPLVPKFLERTAIRKAMAFINERLNGLDGLGGIFPAMANSVMAMDALGYSRDHPDFVIARRSIERLLVFRDGMGYCQPCLSPVWDTGLACLALLETGMDGSSDVLNRAGQWLVERQILDVIGDWNVDGKDLRPGGWAFQYRNDYYPDVDDTAVVVMAMHRADRETYREAIERGTEWIIGMQSKNGGWGAFDIDNDYDFLQNFPFADHGALLDPPTADVSARCIGMMAQLGYGLEHPTVARGIEYLKREQEEDGSWFGRWGNNYIYGTWSVLNAFKAVGLDMINDPHMKKAAEWLKSCQRPDGGWGEDCASYWQHRRDEVKVSTPSQSSWALLGLIAAGEVDSESARLGVEYLLRAKRHDGKWNEEYFNAVGFPRVFYLRYHGYSAYFPLWALARYRDLRGGRTNSFNYGM